MGYNALRVYDRVGYAGLMIAIFILPLIGLPILDILISPFLMIFQAMLNLFAEI